MPMYKRISYILFALVFLASCSGSGSDSTSSADNLRNSACSVIGLQERIINGTSCVESGSPIVPITLVNADGTLAICSGTMLTSRYVLTAAHCFLFQKVNEAYVETPSGTSFATRVTIHPNAQIDQTSGAVFNDVAILQLRKKLNIPSLPIVLSHAAQDGDIISIFGYGLDENSNLGLLKSGQMQISNVTDNHLFSEFNGSGSNTCKGDSGGPAIFSFSREDGSIASGLIGITSSGSQVECGNGDLSIFTNLQSQTVIDFIVSVVPSVGIL